MTRCSSTIALITLLIALTAVSPVANAASLVGDIIGVRLLFPDLSTVHTDFGSHTVVTPAFELTAALTDFDINVEASSVRINILNNRTTSAATFNGFEFSDLDFDVASVVTGFTLSTTVAGYGASRVAFGPDSLLIDLGDLALLGGTFIQVDLITSAVPEPTTMLLWGMTAVGLAAITRCRRPRLRA